MTVADNQLREIEEKIIQKLAAEMGYFVSVLHIQIFYIGYRT